MNYRVRFASLIALRCCTTELSLRSEPKMKSKTVHTHAFGSFLTGFQTRWGSPLMSQLPSENICEARRQIFDNGSKGWRFRPGVSPDTDSYSYLSGKRTVPRREGTPPNLPALCLRPFSRRFSSVRKGQN